MTVRSISDDDLCAKCRFCQYNPGLLSGCNMESSDWPGEADEDGYIYECAEFANLLEGESNFVPAGTFLSGDPISEIRLSGLETASRSYLLQTNVLTPELADELGWTEAGLPDAV
jgi:hypothetical protein